jgi:hypothetical protein
VQPETVHITVKQCIDAGEMRTGVSVWSYWSPVSISFFCGSRAGDQECRRPFALMYKISKLLVNLDRLCGLVVRVPGCTMEMYCVSCEVRTEFIYVM